MAYYTVFKVANKQMLLHMYESCNWPRVKVVSCTASLIEDHIFNKRNKTVWLCKTSVSHGYKVHYNSIVIA